MSLLRSPNSMPSRGIPDDALEGCSIERFVCGVAAAPIVLISDVIANRGIILRNPIANTIVIHIRHVGVALMTHGIALSPGEQMFFPVCDPKNLYAQAVSGTPALEVAVF